jgi:hypothetical protein
MYGEQDPRVTVQQSQQIFRNLHGPKEEDSFAGASHQALVDADPALWESKVSHFLDSLR